MLASGVQQSDPVIYIHIYTYMCIYILSFTYFKIFIYLFIRLAAPGLGCSTQDLHCGVQNLLAVVYELLVVACGI